MLPIDFGPWQTVYGWFRELARRFLFQTIHDVALMVDREGAGREASPSAAVIDSQSIKAPQAKTRGYVRRLLSQQALTRLLLHRVVKLATSSCQKRNRRV